MAVDWSKFTPIDDKPAASGIDWRQFTPVEEEETSWGDFAQGLGADFLGGVQRAARSTVGSAVEGALALPSAAARGVAGMFGYEGPSVSEAATRDVGGFFQPGLDATEMLKPESYRREQATPVFNDDWSFNSISGEQVAGAIASSLPQIPGLLVGGKGLSTALGSKAAGYGLANAETVSQDQKFETFNEVYKEARKAGLDEAKAVEVAQKAADQAEVGTAGLAFLTGAAGLGAAARYGGGASSRVTGGLVGLGLDAPFEGIEEAGQSIISDVAAGREISGTRAASAGVLGAAAGGLPGFAVGALETPSKAPKKQPELVLPDTGVPAFDAGKKTVATMMRAQKDFMAPDNKDTNLNEGPKMPDLFSRLPDVPSAQDMFSGELRPVNPRIPDEDVPVRSEQRQAELESDYIFQQQEKLKEEVRRRMLARKERALPAVDTADMGMGNIVREGQPTSVSERPDLVRRQITDDTINELGFTDDGKNILTKEGNPLNIDEWRLLNKEIETRMAKVMGSTAPVRNNTTMADAFERAGLRRATGLLEQQGGFESEATYPNARGNQTQPIQDGPEVFEPSRVDTINQREPVQQQIEMPERDIAEPLSQPGLFDTPVQQPAAPAATAAPQQAPQKPATNVAALIRAENERSMRDTGKPLSPEQLTAIVAKQQGVPASAVATSPVDQMMIEFEDEEDVNKQIKARLNEDAGLRTVVDQEIAKGDQGSISNVLKAVANTKGANEYQKKLAHVLEMSARNLGIKMVSPTIDPVSGEATRLDPTELGAYSAIDNAIRIRSANPETILHEVAHGVSKAILADKALHAANPKIAQTVQDFSDLLATVKLETEKRSDVIDQYPGLKAHLTRYGTKNIDEFFTMSMTNPEFQKFLSSIKDPNSKGPSKSLWQMFKDMVKRLLGLGRLEGSALDRAMDRTFEIADFARRNPEQVKEATKRVGERIKTRVVEQRKGADQMTLPKESGRKIPKDRGSAANTTQRILSSKWGQIFNKDYEQVQGEIYSGKEAAQRVYTSFVKAGYAKLSEADQSRVNMAMDGKADISDLSPAIQQAVKDYRARVISEQLRLAAESKDEGLKTMIYESMARGDYSTRAYAAFDLKPDAIDAMLYLAHQLTHKGERPKPYWLWKQEKDAPQAVEGLKSYIKSGLIIRDVDSMTDEQKRQVASFYGMKGTEEEIDAQLEAKRKLMGGTEEAQLQNLVDILADPLARENQSVRLDKQAARDMTILMKRKDVPYPIRAFWGEFNQAPLKGSMTMARLTKLVAQTKMINGIVQDGLGNYLFAEGMTAKPGYTKQLPNTESMGALAGLYTRPDIAQQLETIVDTAVGHSKDEFVKAGETAWRAWMKVILPTKTVATVLNVPTALANFYASTTAMATFYLRSSLMGQPIKGLGTTAEAATTALFDTAGKLKEDVARKWIEAGILREGVQLGELNEMIQEFEWEAQQSGSKTKLAVRGARRAGHKMMKVAGAVYQSADNMLRLQAAMIEFNMQKAIHPDKSDAELMAIAADRARDQVPTWGRASPLVKKVGIALGSFPTFFTEVIRTTSHQIFTGLKDLNDGVKSGNKKQAQYGAAQLIGVASQLMMMKTIFPAVVQTVFGFGGEDDEKKQQALAQLVPEFQEGNAVSLMEVDPKTMRAVYTNTDRIDLAGPINTTISRLMNTKDIPGELIDIALDTAGMGPGAQAWSDAVTGTDEFGRALSGEERIEKVGEAYIPRSLAWIDRLQAMERRGVKPEVIAAGKAGLPVYELDTKKDLGFAARDFNKAMNDARGILQRAIGVVDYSRKSETMKPFDKDEFKEDYTEFLRRERDAFDTFSQKIQAAKLLYGEGSRGTIAGILKDETVMKPYREGLLNGQFQTRAFDAKLLADRKRRAIENDPNNKAQIEQHFAKIQTELNTLRKDFKVLLGE